MWFGRLGRHQYAVTLKSRESTLVMTVVETWLELMSNVENFVLNHNFIGIMKPISLGNRDILLKVKRIWWVIRRVSQAMCRIWWVIHWVSQPMCGVVTRVRCQRPLRLFGVVTVVRSLRRLQLGPAWKTGFVEVKRRPPP